MFKRKEDNVSCPVDEHQCIRKNCIGNFRNPDCEKALEGIVRALGLLAITDLTILEISVDEMNEKITGKTVFLEQVAEIIIGGGLLDEAALKLEVDNEMLERRFWDRYGGKNELLRIFH